MSFCNSFVYSSKLRYNSRIWDYKCQCLLLRCCSARHVTIWFMDWRVQTKWDRHATAHLVLSGPDCSATDLSDLLQCFTLLSEGSILDCTGCIDHLGYLLDIDTKVSDPFHLFIKQRTEIINNKKYLYTKSVIYWFLFKEQNLLNKNVN